MKLKADRALGFSGQKWPQLQSELYQFVKILRDEKIRSYLEVGCLYGDTFHTIGMAMGEGARLVGVDLPGTKRGIIGAGKHKRSGEFLERAAADLRRRGREAHVIIGDSHDTDTIARAAAHAPYDAVFIDGDHTLEGARADWENYGPMGRIVAFHDIRGENFRANVRVVWEEARKGHRWIEIAKGDKKGGFGVLWRS